MSSGKPLFPGEADHEAFLSALRDRLRNEADTDIILAETTRRLAVHFGASRTGYGEVDEAQETFSTRHSWIDDTVVSIDAPLPFSIFGEQITGALKRGEIWTHESLDDQKLDRKGREICRELGIAAAITIPLAKNGRFVALVSVQQSSPRRWNAADIALVHEVADRTWATLERARADDARRTSDAILNAIMHHAPIGIYLKDGAGRFQLANEEMARLMKRSGEPITGRTVDELLDPAMAALVMDADREAMTGGVPTVRELKHPGEGEDGHSLAMRVPLQLEGAREPQLAGFEIDVTELKRTQAALERSRAALYQSEKLNALGSLLAGVSHELNNPLAVIVAQAELLELEAADTPAAARARTIRGAAERSARIVQTFLAMARQRRPDRVRVDPNDVIRTAVELVGYGLRSAGITVRQSLAPDLPAMQADGDQLHQVILNLVINAQQALQDWSGERTIAITSDTNAARDTVHLTIADTGPGIPAELHRRIFEPFFTTKAQEMGTGIGLSFSQGVIEAHGGNLEVLQSSEGAVFRIALPASVGPDDPDDVAAHVRPSPGSSPARNRFALVVDDEPQVAQTLADILRRIGFEVATADSGAEAQTFLKEGRFDLIVSDLRMPDVDGPALYAWITSKRPDLLGAVAFSTGDTLNTAAARFLRDADRPFMEKPFTIASVKRLVEAVEGRAR